MGSPIALTRAVSPAIASCELTYLPRVPIDAAKAAAQHQAYEQALESLGCQVVRLPSGPDMPDALFIEDTAVVLDEMAILTRPGAASRRDETDVVAQALERHRPICQIEPPGTMDGGDVMPVGRSIFVGRSTRTNQAAIDQMRRFVSPFAYSVHEVDVQRTLHLKSGVTAVSDDTLLINRKWIPPGHFRAFQLIDVDEQEAEAANIVRVNGHLLYSAAFPRTLGSLTQRGFPASTVDVSEIAKAEGAATCCSLIFFDTR